MYCITKTRHALITLSCLLVVVGIMLQKLFHKINFWASSEVCLVPCKRNKTTDKSVVTQSQKIWHLSFVYIIISLTFFKQTHTFSRFRLALRTHDFANTWTQPLIKERIKMPSLVFLKRFPSIYIHVYVYFVFFVRFVYTHIKYFLPNNDFYVVFPQLGFA